MDVDLKLEKDPEVFAYLVAGINAYNARQCGPYHDEDMTFTIYDGGRRIGGMFAEKWWDWVFIEYLYVEPEYRGSGAGRLLMKRLEAQAREWKCCGICTNSFDFQAPGFYQRLGFEEFGRLEHPPGHNRIFLRKYL
jgi:GNAT superfamily N-acetyltransferase